MRHASTIAAALAISLAILGLGGVHTAVVGLVAALAIVAAGVQVQQAQRSRRAKLSFVGLALGAATVASLLQLLPLPEFLHALLNPVGLDVWARGAEVAGLKDAGWRPLSLDPWSTADRTLRYAALTAIAIWAGNFRERRGWRQFAYLLVPVALLDLLVGGMLYASGEPSFFGLYTPAAGFRGPSTFISTNHGAVFFGFAALVSCAAALGWRREAPRRAAGFALATAVLVVAALGLRSDGVTLALFAAAFTGALVQWLRRGRRTGVSRDVKIGLGLLATLSVVAAVWLDIDRLLGGFFGRIFLSGEHGGRWELISSGAAASLDYWRFGAGAGTIETVLPAYIDWSNLIAASIPVIENDPLELVLSFGWLLGAALLGAALLQFVAVLKPGTSGHTSPRYAIAIVAGVYFALVAQLHFPLFALGISLPVVAWFELLCAHRKSAETRFTPHIRPSRMAMLGGVGLLSAAALGAVYAHVGPYAPSAAATDIASLHHEIWRRPASHVPYIKLATIKARAKELEAAAALADFAVEREPSPRVKLYRAQVLGHFDMQRSAAEFSKLLDGNASRRELQILVRSLTSTRFRADAIEAHPEVWDRVAALALKHDGPDASSSLVVELATRHPNDVRVYRAASRAYLAMNQPVLAQLWAELAGDLEAAGDATNVEAPLLMARALRASGKIEEARAVLEKARENPALVRGAHREALRLRGNIGVTPRDFVEFHHQAVCASPVPAEDQLICWTAEAWLEEESNDLPAAERLLIRVERRHGDPIPLGRFYLRTRNCDGLRDLVRKLDPGPPRQSVQALQARCR